MLDYGCGSGILAIAAARLGAGVVAGTDVDPQAIAASRANAGRNGVVATFALPDEHARAAAALPARHGRFDVVVANILANPLRAAGARAGGAGAGGRHASCCRACSPARPTTVAALRAVV